MAKRNIKLTLSYDGTDYFGYQSQIGGNTIEDNLRSAIKKITDEKLTVYCAGRTDTGVHAEGQIVNFHVQKRDMSEDEWLNALNSFLPDDIRILMCEFADHDFHARKSALFREYWYKIINAPVISALESRYALHYSYPLDTDLLQAYCNFLIGENDFTSFSSIKDKSRSKIRFMHSIKVEKQNSIIIIKIKANAFLYNMIRIIIGTLLELHKLDKPPEEMKNVLNAKERKKAGQTFDARGLVFKKVHYDPTV